jgi:hypothetical protein
MEQSLILKEQAEVERAPFLFHEDEIPRIDKTRPKFHCTGERLFRDRPDVYKAIVRLLAEPGVTIRTICRECHVTDDVVRSVKARENIPIAHEKKTVLANMAHGVRLGSERVIELMPTAALKDALLGVGILTDKMQLLSGEATMRVETVERVDIYADWEEFVQAQLPAGENVIEISPETGSVAGKKETNSSCLDSSEASRSAGHREEDNSAEGSNNGAVALLECAEGAMSK